LSGVAEPDFHFARRRLSLHVLNDLGTQAEAARTRTNSDEIQLRYNVHLLRHGTKQVMGHRSASSHLWATGERSCNNPTIIVEHLDDQRSVQTIV